MEPMKTLSQLTNEPGIWMEEKPLPEVGHNDILIQIIKTAICGTDIHIYNWDEWAQRTIPVPMTIGHEFVGIVEEVGNEVKGINPDDRVSGEGHVTCGHCRNCRAGRRHLCRNTIAVGVNRQGCFAEYLSIPAVNAFVVPDAISDDIASIFDPFGNATHTTLSFDLVGEDVLITGAGPIGIMAVAIARHVGARHVVISDINDYRLDLAKKMGATRAVNVGNTSIVNVMMELDMQEGFDVGLELSGNPNALENLLFLRPTPPFFEEKALYVSTIEEALKLDMGDGNFSVLALVKGGEGNILIKSCLLYTSDAADE